MRESPLLSVGHPSRSGRSRLRAVTAEANEVPPAIFRQFVERTPLSHTAARLRVSRLIATTVTDVVDFPYPSQTQGRA